jgi:hypothetical protein
MYRYETRMYSLGGRPHWGLDFDNISGSNGLLRTMYPARARVEKDARVSPNHDIHRRRFGEVRYHALMHGPRGVSIRVAFWVMLCLYASPGWATPRSHHSAGQDASTHTADPPVLLAQASSPALSAAARTAPAIQASRDCWR